MPASNQLKNQHLLWRAAFGPMAENAGTLVNLSQNKLWALLQQTSSKAPEKIKVSNGLLDGYMQGVTDPKILQDMRKDPKMQRQMRQQKRDELKKLNVQWMDEMINSGAQLREKLSFFWHGHFACRVVNSFFQQELLHAVRLNALGNFGTLLKEVSKSPAMLQFLNNQQNKKGHPNENFAREVMELFTMGRGNYTENDVKEGARAFTGWAYNLQGEFVFRKNQHDDGEKTFLGETGNFNGDDILNILLKQKATARYITEKMYRFFVNEKPDINRIETLSTAFYKSNYDISALLKDIFLGDWFYDEKNIGSLIKSPIELLVGIRRILPLEMDNDEAQILFQKVLGQILFYPPNVAGWPGGRSWIDSSTLMVRLQVPQVLSAKESISISPKVDDDVQMGQKKEELVRIARNKAYMNKGASSVIDWSAIFKIFEKVSKTDLAKSITNMLWQTNTTMSSAVVSKFVDESSRETFIKSSVINLMSTPEYQMS